MHIQNWAKEWALGFVNSPPAAGGSQEAGFPQPRAHSFAQPCIWDANGIGHKVKSQSSANDNFA